MIEEDRVNRASRSCENLFYEIVYAACTCQLLNVVFDSLREGGAIAETHRVAQKTRVPPIKIRRLARGASLLLLVAAL